MDDSLSSGLVAHSATTTPAMQFQKKQWQRAIAGSVLLSTIAMTLVVVALRAGGAAKYQDASARLAASPSIQRFPKISELQTPSMNDPGNSYSFLKDVAFSPVHGKEMSAGLYRLDAGPPLQYTYTYEEFKYVLEGEFHLVDGTGQRLVATRGDLLYFPCGTNVTFSTPHSALGYYVGQRVTPEPAVEVTAAVRAAAAANPAMQLIGRIDVRSVPKMSGAGDSNSFFGDVAASSAPGKEMAAGLYHLDAGPSLHYTYAYEEFKFVIEGQFELRDGSGQRLVAEPGDLLYFPRGTEVVFSSPHSALGYFVGQRHANI